jgi:excisionase family DNA binding protein
MSEERFYSVEEVAARLMVDKQTVRRWIKSGRLSAYKPGLEWRIHSGDLDTFLEARRPTALPKDRPPSLEEIARATGHQLGWIMASEEAFRDAFKGRTWREVLNKATHVVDEVQAEQRDFMAFLIPIVQSTPYSEENNQHFAHLYNRINGRLLRAHTNANEAADKAEKEGAPEEVVNALREVAPRV